MQDELGQQDELVSQTKLDKQDELVLRVLRTNPVSHHVHCAHCNLRMGADFFQVVKQARLVRLQQVFKQHAQRKDSLAREGGSSLVTGHIPTHPFLVASPDPNPALTQTLDLSQGRVGTWPATERGPARGR